MGLILTIMGALVLWIVIWSLGHSGLDAAFLSLAIIVVGTAVRLLVTRLPGRRS